MTCKEVSVAAFAAIALFSCKNEGPSGGRICTTEARAGIQVTIRDAATSAPAAQGAIATAQDQSYTDTLQGFFDSLTVAGAYERPGVYTVVVKKAGYRDWRQTNILVTSDECHVITVTLDARLERP